MNTLYYFIQSLPECMGLLALSFAIAKVPLRWGTILVGAVLVSVISFGIRALPVTFGFHIPLMIFILFLLIIRLTRVTPSRTVIAVFSSFFVLAVLEYLVSSAFFTLTGMDPNKAIANDSLWAIIGIIQAVILNLIALVVSHFFKPFEELWKK